MGLWLSRPTVGVAKSRLFGRFTEPGPEPGDRSDLIHPHTGQPIGTVLRTRRGSKPLFISPGDRIDVPHAEAIVRRCLTGYRLPEPTR
jgi:deoxyribonuclease V